MKLENLTDIFNNKIFRIPDYQRGYSWENPQLEDLWRDLEILEKGESHYTGMLSVKFDAEKDIYYVIDGQQRITTLTILIKVIVDKFASDDWLNDKEVSDYIKTFLYKKTGSQGEITKMIFGYVDKPSHIHFKTEILKLDNTDDSTPKDTLYTINLSNAKEFFANKIQGLNEVQSEKLLKKITTNLKFNFYQIEDELNEFVAFETMNNRGKPLSTLELLKNRLIYLSTLLSNHDESEKNKLRESINNAWKTIYEYLGKNPDAVIKDDDFLQNHCFIYFKFDKNINKKYKDFLLKKHFTATRVALKKRHKELLGKDGFTQEYLDKRTITYADIKNYVADIQKSVKHYYFVHNVGDSQCPYTDKEKTIISKINRVGFQSFKPIIVVLCSQEKYETARVDLFKYIEKYIFTRFNIEYSRLGTGSTDFYHLANKFQKNELSVDLTLNLIEKITYDFDKDGLWSSISKKFVDKILNLDEGFYNWKGLRYFLYEYELYLQKQHQGEIKVEWEHINKETIEHIYPQTPDNVGWKNTFNNDNLLNDLGNLLLLSKSINSSVGNKPFEIKKDRFSTNSHSAIAISKLQNWTPEEILKRRKNMLDFMDENWDIEISDEVIKLLDEANNTALKSQK
jgi:uncharacterized protein with ParB-like and HNH nuclease domain